MTMETGASVLTISYIKAYLDNMTSNYLFGPQLEKFENLKEVEVEGKMLRDRRVQMASAMG